MIVFTVVVNRVNLVEMASLITRREAQADVDVVMTRTLRMVIRDIAATFGDIWLSSGWGWEVCAATQCMQDRYHVVRG